jgi:hypothetical protein
MTRGAGRASESTAGRMSSQDASALRAAKRGVIQAGVCWWSAAAQALKAKPGYICLMTSERLFSCGTALRTVACTA